MNAVSAADVVMVDVVVGGAGPAGAAFALNLAPFHRVLLIDKGEGPATHVGESLPAAAGRLLRDMGLMKAFLAQGHEPCHARYSAWGHAGLARHDAMRDLDGHGWHLDRARFDAWLRAVAQERGALWWPRTQCLSVQAADADGGGKGGWDLLLHHGGRERRVHARLVVDASGRGASLARRMGIVRRVDDKLICGWVRGRDRHPHGLGGVVSEPGGWWYSAPLPDGERLLAFYTDADLPDARDAHDLDALLRRMQRVPHLRGALEDAGFEAEGWSGFCAARGEWLSRWHGPGWLAIGDAAFSFDPLSSQGIFNALYTGLLAAELSHRELSAGGRGRSPTDELPDWAGYERALSRIHAAYREHLALWYRQESRWNDQPFWRRRLPRSDSEGAGAPPDLRSAHPA